jgi:ketosteroid isomerase-like protein
MKLRLIFAALLFATASAAADINDEIRCREINFSRSVENRDSALFATFIDADARFVGNSVMHGPAEISAAWAVFFAEKGPTIKWRPQFVEVLQDGTLALTRGPYRMITSDEQGQKTEHWGTFNSVWRLQDDGRWKVVFDTGSDSDEPPAKEIQALLDQGSDCKT